MGISRRHFIKNCGLVAVGFSGLLNYSCRPSASPALADAGFGPLLSDPEGILDLPASFSYKVISRAGEMMDDGFFVPGAPDAMAAFPGPRGLTVLLRNHELNPGMMGPFGENNELLDKLDKSRIYDRGFGTNPSCGGTTTLLYNTKTQSVELQFLSLTGTIRNCAGGMTPWNSWISCEETVQRAEADVCEKDHGYNFEVPASSKIGLADPLPLKAMGRFNHEAVAVDSATSIVYQTEDRGDGLLYRFIPNVRERLAEGGRLQVLKIRDRASADMRNWDGSESIAVGEKMAVEWLDIDDVESPEDDLRKRGFTAGAARFARGEGMWRGDDGIYFVCTNGGRVKYGQVFKYVPGKNEGSRGESGGILELFVEPNDGEIVKNADNLTIAPWGDLILCEDRSGDTIRLVGVTPQGALYTFAHHHMRTEFAGATFSPDGSTMFVNIQGKGTTLAISGPWKS